MGTLVKKETYTTTQPDGTILTTTTKTRTQQSDEYEYTWTTINVDYCCTPAAILRILQIIVGFIIVGCVSGIYGTGPFKGILSGQTFLLVFACLCICITFILLVVLFLGLHSSHCSEVPWRYIDLIFSIIAAIIFLICTALEGFYGSGYWSECSQWEAGNNLQQCPVYPAWIAAAVFCFILAILYAIGAWLASKSRYFR